MSRQPHRSPPGFTLVELLIVVIILGIAAAVVIPQANMTASESKEAALASNLATIRMVIDLYKVQHNDDIPDDNIVAQLTTSTDENGNVSTNYGPYLRTSFPANPINGDSDVKTLITMPNAPSGSEGWIYATSNGEFRANVTGTGPSGTNYFDL